MIWRRLWWVVLLMVAWLPAFPALASPGALPPVPTPVPDTPSALVSPNAPGSPTAAPTVDRLAAPPTVANPNQADIGAQLFWQHCQPCHGDQAQGLTDEWRAQYPPEDQNCWKSGCHGDRPYQGGFTLPHTVPALVGPGTLGHFATAADLFAFMSHAMPFQAPGSLKPTEYWAITAFLLRGHGLPASGLPIADAAAAQRVPLGTPAATSAAPTLTPAPGPSLGVPAGAAVAVAVLAVAGLSWLAWRRTRGHG
jgi:mono/diheme cytochrome c family protein